VDAGQIPQTGEQCELAAAAADGDNADRFIGCLGLLFSSGSHYFDPLRFERESKKQMTSTKYQINPKLQNQTTNKIAIRLFGMLIGWLL
jgi:hypothetical protein